MRRTSSSRKRWLLFAALAIGLTIGPGRSDRATAQTAAPARAAAPRPDPPASASPPSRWSVDKKATLALARCLSNASHREPRTYGELGETLRDTIRACSTAQTKARARSLNVSHGLSLDTESIQRTESVIALFELTRDAGPWRVRWDITDEEPSAKLIWASWAKSPPKSRSARPSVVAECDEISSLFAGLAAQMSLGHVGLYWPTSNHTVAAWEPAPNARIMIPTTQIYLACDANIDTPSFDPKKQKRVFAFPKNDVRRSSALPPELSRFLVDEAAAYLGASAPVLEMIRIDRGLRYGSSIRPTCRAHARAIARAGTQLSPADALALRHYARSELDLAAATAADALRVLSSR